MKNKLPYSYFLYRHTRFSIAPVASLYELAAEMQCIIRGCSCDGTALPPYKKHP